MVADFVAIKHALVRRIDASGESRPCRAGKLRPTGGDLCKSLPHHLHVILGP